jgi:hypothetical protein
MLAIMLPVVLTALIKTARLSLTIYASFQLTNLLTSLVSTAIAVSNLL